MGNSPAFQFYAADFLIGIMGMSDDEIGVYIKMLAFQWEREFLPNDAKLIKKIIGSSRVPSKTVMAKFEVCSDGNLRNARLEKERQKQISFRETRAANAQQRWKKDSTSNARASDMHIENGCITDALHTSSSSSDIIAPTQAAKPAWSSPHGWVNVEPLRTEFASAFPACNFDLQLERAAQWLKANPTKAHKSNWRKFLSNWFGRCQDRGGDGKGAARPHSAQSPQGFDRSSIDRAAFDAWAAEEYHNPPTLDAAAERVITRYLEAKK